MIDEFIQQSHELERAKIISETAKIPWLELQRFFAAGKLIWVANDLDLVEIAWTMQRDDAKQVGAWMEQQQLVPVTDDQARRWIAEDSLLWAVTIKPWILVQDLKAED
jgi:hypothetical protein